MTAAAAFLDFELEAGPEVLRPRGETEILAEQAIAIAARDGCKRIADWGCGSGALALALAAKLPAARIEACDLSAAACATARRNLRRLGLANVEVREGDWLACAGPYDLIVSNPPYVTSALSARLRETGALADPLLALDGGPDGLACFGGLIPHAWRCLAPGGTLACEHG
ncbi:MAG: HemK family protein methyltransferase, partial [Betaproteobacteria bacterium AqS2]|nr:HemK family protein methyltransferase [Betaproteobacteria bacterium AqS2]